jgi:predicted lipoprotein with Yx(FWY)xxD motif/plastocyanin
MKFRSIAPILLTIALLLAACSSATPTQPAAQPTQPAAQPTQPPAAPTAAAAPTGPTIELGQSADLGSFLVDAKGMTLYLFTKDTPNTTVCYDDCAVAWPPLLAEGAPVAGQGVDAAKLGLTQRKDGTSQVTYNGWPLYYFAKDVKPGDITGQDVGGVWFVLSAAGDKVEAALPVATMTMSSADTSNSNANANSNSNANANANSNANSNSNDNANANANSNSNDNSSVAGGSASVDIRNFAFDPSPLTVKVGTTVTWENKDSAKHNVIADNGAFKSGALGNDDKFSFTFTEAGTYLYYCSFHGGGPGGQGMSGQVIVTP